MATRDKPFMVAWTIFKLKWLRLLGVFIVYESSNITSNNVSSKRASFQKVRAFPYNETLKKTFGPWNRNKHPEDGDWISSCIQLMNKNLAPPGEVKKKNLLKNGINPLKPIKTLYQAMIKLPFPPPVFWNAGISGWKILRQLLKNQPRRATEPMASRFRGVFLGGWKSRCFFVAEKEFSRIFL